MWAPPPPAPSDAMPPPQLPFLPLPPPNRGWKRKNPNNNNAYQPPAIGDLQVQNRAKARRWFKNPNNPNSNNNPNNRKYFFRKPKAAAPRNTTSFIIRAKRAGGIASLVSPCPVTPAVLPTPVISPSREGLSDMAQEQWGVDGYGSMKGLIRLRSSPQPPNAANGSDDEVEENSSGSDVEEHVEVERRLDHDLSRFEMVYPGRGEEAGGYLLEDDDEYDQDVHVARLEEENLTLKERLFLMEQEVGDMRRRLEAIEARFSGAGGGGSGENVVVEAPENGTERANAVGVADDAVEVALENGTERANAVDVADSAVEGALENGIGRANVVDVADNAVEGALDNGTEKGDTDGDNAVEEALKNGLESAVGADDVVEEGLKNDTEMGDADKTVEQASENGTGRFDAASGADNAVEESLENDMGSAAVEPEKSCNDSEKNAEMIDAGSGEDNGEERKQA